MHENALPAFRVSKTGATPSKLFLSFFADVGKTVKKCFATFGFLRSKIMFSDFPVFYKEANRSKIADSAVTERENGAIALCLRQVSPIYKKDACETLA